MTSLASSERTPLLQSYDSIHRSSRKPYPNPLVAVACVIFGALVGSYVQPLSVWHSEVATGAKPTSSPESSPQPMTVRQTMKSSGYNPDADFHSCLTNSTTPADPAFASWKSDGSAKAKRDDLNKQALVHPIGTVIANGESIKIYDVPLTFLDGDKEDGNPVTSLRTAVDKLKDEAGKICQNPLHEIITQGGVKNTSKACADTLSQQASDVHDAYQACVTTVTTGLAELDDYSTWASKTYQLRTDRSNLVAKWQLRQQAGRDYDAAFAEWLSVYNNAVGSCTFANSYLDYSNDVRQKFTNKLEKQRKEIEDVCTLPSLEPFDVNKAVVQQNAAKLGDSDSDGGMCHSILESIDGLTNSATSEHSGRANCLEFYCEKYYNDEPEKSGVMNGLLTAYNTADNEFNTAKQKFDADVADYIAYETAIKTNKGLIEKTIEDARRNDNSTQAAMSKFLFTAACAPSTICCQAPEVIPEICARNANGEVAVFEPGETYDDFVGVGFSTNKVRFVVFENAGHTSIMQFSELRLLTVDEAGDDVIIDADSVTCTVNPNKPIGFTANDQKVENACDGKLETKISSKFQDKNKNSRWTEIEFTLDASVRINGYEVCTADTSPSSNPKGWMLVAKMPTGFENDWYLLDSQDDGQLPKTPLTCMTFAVDYVKEVYKIQTVKSKGDADVQLGQINWGAKGEPNKIVPIEVYCGDDRNNNEYNNRHAARNLKMGGYKQKWFANNGVRHDIMFFFEPDYEIEKYKMFTADNEYKRDPEAWNVYHLLQPDMKWERVHKISDGELPGGKILRKRGHSKTFTFDTVPRTESWLRRFAKKVVKKTKGFVSSVQKKKKKIFGLG
jgi:hypothetical protein